MAGGVGNLSVGLSLDYAAYTAGLTKAQRQAQQFTQQFKASFAGNLAAGFADSLIRGLAGVPAQLANVVKGAIDAADHLNDLSKKTGIAADTLGGIGFAAQQAGGDLESAAAGIGKLNKSIAEAAAGNKEAAEGFAAIGVSVKDAAGATKNADQVLSEVSDKFASYADGPEKAALALRLFGKAGAEMIPLLNEGGAALQGNIAYFKRYSGVTTETAKAADQFNDTLTKISLLTKAFATTIASELLGPLQAVATRFLEAKEQGSGFAGVAKLIKEGFIGVATAASFVVETVAAASAVLDGFVQKAGVLKDAFPARTGNVAIDAFNQARAIASDDVQRQFKIISDLQDEGVKAARTRHERLVAALNFTDDPTNFSNEGRNQIRKPKAAPRLPASGAGLDDPTRKLLEARLKAIDGEIQREQDLFQTRNRFLDFYNNQNLLSIQDYYSGRTAAQAEALRNESDLINQEIELVRQHQSIKGLSKKDQAADEVKVQELIARRTRLEQHAGEQTIFLAAAQSKAYDELANDILGVSAQVLDLRENFALAAAVRFDLQFDALKKTFTREGNEAGKEAIATLRAATIAQAAFQKATLDSSRTLEDLANQEQRISIAVQAGRLTSLEALAQEGEARRAMIPILERQVAAAETLAAIEKAKGTAGADDLARKAEQGRIALDKLKASADPLAESLNKMFGDDFNSALDDFVSGTKSAADAFKAFGKSVLADILKMGTKSITESIFGGSGGAGGFIAQLVKDAGANAAPGGLIGALQRSLGGGGNAVAAAPSAADDGTTAAIKATIATLGGLGTSAAAATEAIGTQSSALLDSLSAFDAFSQALSTAGDSVGELVADLANLFSSSGGGGGEGVDWSALVETFAGFFAGGGTIPPGQWGVVGENGKELAFGGRTGQTIQPVAAGGQSLNVNVTVQGAPGQPRDSLLQQGATIGMGIQRAMARNT